MNTESVKSLARECGFELAGVCSALPSSDFGRYQSWIHGGMSAQMDYLSDHRADLRSDPRKLLPSAKSILCVGKLYNRTEPYSVSREGAMVSRYAGGSDYHTVMRAQLQSLANRLLDLEPTLEYTLCVDTAPLLERTYARLAGLGWIGKNTCLIHEGDGSWFFLGEILVSINLDADEPAPSRCGSCTRCIDACPTNAIVPDGNWFRVDSRACISYLTIEHRGDIPNELRSPMGQHLFGCDICQDVCPWNRQAPVTEEAAFHSGTLNPDLAELAALSPSDFHSRFRSTPLWRAKYSGLLRNTAVAMGNSGDRSHIPALEHLEKSDHPVVSAHASWALHQLRS